MGEEHTWIRYIHQRIKKNKNFLATITGQTGSGKSWSGLSIGEMLDKEFNIDRVIFKGTELMKLINGGTLKSGSVIIWDEAGVDLSNRNWQSMTNKLLNYLLQTFRHRNFILLFTVPFHDFLDASTRKLFHADFQTMSIDKNTNECILKPKILQYYAPTKKWYTPHLKKINLDGQTVKIKRWRVPKPSDELITAYENRKNGFTSELNKDIEHKLNKIEEKDNRDYRKPLTPLWELIVGCWKKGMKKQMDIAKELKRTDATISGAILAMRKNGYKKEEFLPKNTT